MRHLKLFEDYIKDGIVKLVSKNPARAKSLIVESERKTRSLKERIKK